MNGRLVFRILYAVILITVLAGFGIMIYNAGIAQGIAAGGSFIAPVQPSQDMGAAQLPYRYYGYGPFIRPWGFGFFPFGCLFPLLFFFLFFALFRGFFFRGWRGRGWNSPHYHGWGGGQDVPPPFEEWHRRSHQATETPAEDMPRE